MPTTIRDIARDVMIELGIPGAADTVSSEDATLVLNKYLRLLDNWNAEREAVYGEVFTQYTITPNLQPHTIGPTGATFTVAQRPVTIDGASIVINTSTPSTYSHVEIRDYRWWQDNAVPGITGRLPTDLYYDPVWPNGGIYLWPVPTVAYPLSLMTRALLTTVTLNTTFSLPPGYQDAITLTLAEECASSFTVPVSPTTEKSAQKARARIFGNNTVIPRIQTQDAGMPGGRSGCRPTFNFMDGSGR